MRVARAKHLSENNEVAAMLFSEQKKLEALELSGDVDEEELVPKERDAERQRKLARLKAVTAKEDKEEENKAVTTIYVSGNGILYSGQVAFVVLFWSFSMFAF